MTGAGGRVIVPPLEVDGQGRMAMFADDQEALFAAWQPGAFPGCGLVNEPGCFCWSELACRGHRGGGPVLRARVRLGRPKPARWGR